MATAAEASEDSQQINKLINMVKRLYISRDAFLCLKTDCGCNDLIFCFKSFLHTDEEFTVQIVHISMKIIILNILEGSVNSFV